MKYFTSNWCFGNLEDHEIDHVLCKYKKYIKNIYKKLPFVLRLFCRGIHFHDGIIKFVQFCYKEKKLSLNGVFGDLKTGYFVLNIDYFVTQLFNSENLNTIFLNNQIEILSDEIDLIQDGIYTHRFLFNTKSELEIIFSDVQITIQNTSPLSYKKAPCELKIWKEEERLNTDRA